MSRKDYVELAALIAGLEDRIAAEVIGVKVADICKRDNERFDYVRFYQACDVTPGRFVKACA